MKAGAMKFGIFTVGDGPVHPWFGKDIRQGIPLAIEHYALLHKLWRKDAVDGEGKFRTPLQPFTATPHGRRRPAPIGPSRPRPDRVDPRPGQGPRHPKPCPV
ncbi:LLM class flavin-dependent oxidoreductase [Streptomyces sp. NPDC018000]|uniref:LLM class flavin-dependent oxidoreductase n=1 Tax=Streptomyces sp. NPDC018000 TaxID=3365028 RepID=UPI0037A6F018